MRRTNIGAERLRQVVIGPESSCGDLPAAERSEPDFREWNRTAEWLKYIDALRRAAA